MNIKQEKLEQFRQRCRACHLAVTVQRLAVYEYLINTVSHPTADQVFEAVSLNYPTVSRTSIYRILDKLVQFGIIQKLSHSGATVRYDGNTSRHHHLTCSQCGRIIDEEFSAEEINLDAFLGKRQNDSIIADYSVMFIGICADCVKNKKLEKEK